MNVLESNVLGWEVIQVLEFVKVSNMFFEAKQNLLFLVLEVHAYYYSSRILSTIGQLTFEKNHTTSTNISRMTTKIVGQLAKMLSLQLPQNTAHLLMNSLMAKNLQIFPNARNEKLSIMNNHFKFGKRKLTKRKKQKKKREKNWL